MFNNPGKKIQTLATVFFIVLSIASVGLGIVLAVENAAFMALGLSGVLFAYIGGLFLYGFGQLILNTSKNDVEEGAASEGDPHQELKKGTNDKDMKWEDATLMVGTCDYCKKENVSLNHFKSPGSDYYDTAICKECFMKMKQEGGH